MGRFQRPFRILTRSLLGIALFSGCVWAGFYIWQRGEDGRIYLQNLRPAAAKLLTICSSLSKTSDQILLEQDPPTSRAQTIEKFSKLRALSKDVQREHTHFESTAGNYKAGPYLPFITDAQRAAASHEHAIDTSAQIHELLGDYRALLDVLEKFYMNHADLTTELQKFNNISDLNTLQGSSERLRSTAATIDSQRIVLQQIAPPAGLEQVWAQSIAVHQEASAGFRALAQALSPPIDNLIYSSAKQIESATDDNDSVNILLSQKLQAIPTISDVTALPEKVTLLRF
jgi:hypothetical protein